MYCLAFYLFVLITGFTGVVCSPSGKDIPIVLVHGITIGNGTLLGVIPVLEDLCGDKKYPILLDTGRGTKVASDTRQLLADKFKKFRTAEAVVCHNYYQKILAQLYMSVNRPGNPVKVFSDFDSAEAWLIENFL